MARSVAVEGQLARRAPPFQRYAASLRVNPSGDWSLVVGIGDKSIIAAFW